MKFSRALLDPFRCLAVGLCVAKTGRIGKVPVKMQLGAAYSVVSLGAFGQQAQVELNIIPVIPFLVENPILGGKRSKRSNQ